MISYCFLLYCAVFGVFSLFSESERGATKGLVMRWVGARERSLVGWAQGAGNSVLVARSGRRKATAVEPQHVLPDGLITRCKGGFAWAWEIR